MATSKDVLGTALMHLIGAAENFADTFWRETVVGQDRVDLHTQPERQAYGILQSALSNAQSSLQVAARVAEKDEDDDMVEI